MASYPSSCCDRNPESGHVALHFPHGVPIFRFNNSNCSLLVRLSVKAQTTFYSHCGSAHPHQMLTPLPPDSHLLRSTREIWLVKGYREPPELFQDSHGIWQFLAFPCAAQSHTLFQLPNLFRALTLTRLHYSIPHGCSTRLGALAWKKDESTRADPYSRGEWLYRGP